MTNEADSGCCPAPKDLNDAAILERFRIALANAGTDTPPGFEQHWKDTYDILAKEVSTLGLQLLAVSALFCDDAMAANPEAPRSVVFRLAAEAALRGSALMVRSARQLDGLKFDAARFGLFAFSIADAAIQDLPEGTEHPDFPTEYSPGQFRKFVEAKSLNAAEETALLRARVRELEHGIKRAVELMSKPEPASNHSAAEHLQDLLASDVKPMDLAFAIDLASMALAEAGWRTALPYALAGSEADVHQGEGVELPRASIVTSIAEHLRNNV